MKALTLTQPWASLVALGAKHIETRSWTTRYRGQVAIHAAAGLPPGLRRGDIIELGEWSVERDQSGLLLRGPISWPYRLPLGAVVAMAQLFQIRRTDSHECCPDDRERPLGDYSPGRYAWSLSSVQTLAMPIAAKGALGLWEWEAPSDLEDWCRRPRAESSLGAPS